MHGKLTCKRLN